MRYIQRQSTLARSVHWVHMIATLALFATGALLYIPAIADALGVDALQVSRLIHRGAAIAFIAIPALAIVLRPSAAWAKIKEYFAPWSAEDKEFMRKFIPYLFSPKTVQMPKQGRYKSGQILADGMIIVFAILIAISGAFMWAAGSFSPALLRWMYVIHDVSMVILGVLVLSHLYLGAGIFKPYRGTGRIMFGDGKVSEADARYHWGHWAESELEDGSNVTEG